MTQKYNCLLNKKFEFIVVSIQDYWQWLQVTALHQQMNHDLLIKGILSVYAQKEVTATCTETGTENSVGPIIEELNLEHARFSV